MNKNFSEYEKQTTALLEFIDAEIKLIESKKDELLELRKEIQKRVDKIPEMKESSEAAERFFKRKNETPKGCHECDYAVDSNFKRFYDCVGDKSLFIDENASTKTRHPDCPFDK